MCMVLIDGRRLVRKAVYLRENFKNWQLVSILWLGSDPRDKQAGSERAYWHDGTLEPVKFGASLG